VEKIVRPFQDFAHKQASGGILLIAATVIALLWANSPWAGSYAALWHTKLTVGVGDASISKDLTHWINDGLMAVFFLVVGLEIKREVLVGELSSVRGAALPFAAALGGAVVPAAIYLAINAGTEGSAGWGIPMATDIAFALGVLALLGERAPVALKVFLTALAIVDDIVAVLVIAFFYTSEISWGALGVGAVFLATLVVANLIGVGRTLVYAVLGVGLWLCFLLSGVHATIAGVLLALTVPGPVAIGIVAGLLIGKQLGITLFAWLAVKSGFSELPEGIRWRHVYGAGWLAGIGFTMSLFITDLSFSDGSLVAAAKLGILIASLIAGVVGWTILRGASSPH
jgi:NhaA family Na+:H+ antiporter